MRWNSGANSHVVAPQCLVNRGALDLGHCFQLHVLRNSPDDVWVDEAMRGKILKFGDALRLHIGLSGGSSLNLRETGSRMECAMRQRGSSRSSRGEIDERGAACGHATSGECARKGGRASSQRCEHVDR